MSNSLHAMANESASSHAHVNHNLTGFIIFLCSESVIFLAFFSGYAILKTSALDWLPPGVEGLEWRTPLVNTAVLISISMACMWPPASC